MFAEIRRLFTHTTIYGLGDIIGRSISFLLIPLYTHTLSQAEYGLMSLVYVFIGFVNVLYALGLNTAFLRFFIAEKDGEERKKIYSSAVFLLAGTSFVASLCLWFASPFLSGVIFRDPDSTTCMRLVAAILFVDTVAQFPLLVLRSLEKSKHYTAITILRLVTTVALNIVFVLGLRWGVEGILISNLIASACIFLVLLPLSLRYVKRVFSGAILRKMLDFGLPMVPAVLSVLVIDLSDRYILEHFKGLEQVGVYSLGYKLGMIMTFFVSAFRFAWPPFFLTIAEQEDAKVIYARVLTYFLLVGAAMFLGISLYLKIIMRLFIGEQYWSASPIVPLILLSYLFYGLYVNFTVGTYIQKKTRSILYIAVLAAAINIAFNLLFIPRFGMMGAAAATLLAYISMAVFLFLVNRRMYPIDYEVGRILKIGLAAGVIYAVHLVVSSSSLGIEIALKTILLAGFFGLLLVFRFFQAKEFQALARRLRRA